MKTLELFFWDLPIATSIAILMIVGGCVGFIWIGLRAGFLLGQDFARGWSKKPTLSPHFKANVVSGKP